MTFDFKNFGDLVVFLTAVVGLISTIYNLIVKPTANNDKPTEVSQIKFLKLQRQEVGLRDWWKLELFYVLLVAGSLGIIGVSAYHLYVYVLEPLNFNQTIKLLIYSLSLLFGIYLAFLYSYLLLKMGRVPGKPLASLEAVEANIFLFKCADIDVKGDYDAVFSECTRALRNLDASIVTLNYANGILRGVVTRFLGGILNIGGTLNIKITPYPTESTGKSESIPTPVVTSDHYTIKIDVKQGGLLEIQTLPGSAEQTNKVEKTDNTYHIEVVMTRGFSLFKVTANSSRIIIHFIEQLMGK